MTGTAGRWTSEPGQRGRINASAAVVIHLMNEGIGAASGLIQMCALEQPHA
jgi:hypothetical protein